ncbi:uncharacterized protein LOC134259162 [Saccostrea cucullata]|uniref:uncharacterized protein LOC134259162 n=1 Tax=Saccostrea cuccullata TaxID=36930 RepID=UPI002ED16272
MIRLANIRKSFQQKLRENYNDTQEQANLVMHVLKRKRTQLVDTVELIEKNNRAMSDYSLIDNCRELKKLLSEIKKYEYPTEYKRGKIYDDLLENSENVSLVSKEIDSFQYKDNAILILEAFGEDDSYVQSFFSKSTCQVNKKGVTKKKLKLKIFDICVLDNGEVYFTDDRNLNIFRFSKTGSVSEVLDSDIEYMKPLGICQSVDGGLLVTMMDTESKFYHLMNWSFRSVEHLTLTGDIENLHLNSKDKPLLIYPRRVTQNGNGDICIVNWRNSSEGDLVILTSSGILKSVYRGQNIVNNSPFQNSSVVFDPYDVVCDSLCNILVTDARNHKIHLLDPAGKFLKFCLTEKEMIFPTSLSLYKSTLWAGNTRGQVKVFQYSHAFSIKI